MNDDLVGVRTGGRCRGSREVAGVEVQGPVQPGRDRGTRGAMRARDDVAGGQPEGGHQREPQYRGPVQVARLAYPDRPGQPEQLRAPEIARLGGARLNCARVALLGTLRRDGSPRISPIEPYLAQGQLLVGAMAWSGKADDLRRDPRYVLHSAVTGPDSGEGELKLWGLAVEAGQDLRGAAAEAWWPAWPPDKAIVFCLPIQRAVFVEWDTEHGSMTVHRWSPGSGYSQTGRTYP